MTWIQKGSVIIFFFIFKAEKISIQTNWKENEEYLNQSEIIS